MHANFVNDFKDGKITVSSSSNAFLRYSSLDSAMIAFPAF